MSIVSVPITITQQAENALAFAETAEKLKALAKESERIVEINSPAAYAECHAARMKLKNQRIEIEKISKQAREEATKFSKEVIVVERKLVELISPEEERLETLQQEEDHRRAAEKRAKIEAEEKRVDALRARVLEIVRIPSDSYALDAAELLFRRDRLSEVDVSEEAFAEFAGEAAAARETAIGRLEGMIVARRDEEDRAAALKAQELELARQREEDARRRALEEEAAAKRRQLEEVRDRILGEFRRALESAATAPSDRLGAVVFLLSKLEVPPIDDEAIEAEIQKAHENVLSELERLHKVALERECHEANEAALRAAREVEERAARAERDRQEHEAREQRRRDEEAEAGRREEKRREDEARLERERAELAAAKARLAAEAEQRQRDELERRAGETELLPAAAAVLELCDVEGLGSRPEVVLLRLVIGRQSAPAPAEGSEAAPEATSPPARSCSECGAVEPFPHEDGCSIVAGEP